MGNLFKVAELLVEKVKGDYKEDVAIIGYYGSYAEGTQNPKSDLDIFFVPKTNRGYELGECFIIEDIGIDLFPISWERAEGIANFEEVIVSVLADCKILYAATDEDLNRFEALRDQIKSFGTPEKRAVMINKAQGVFNRVYANLYNINKLKELKDYTAIRVEAYKILTTVMESTALLNQTYLKKGWGKNLQQVMEFEKQPKHLKGLIEAIIMEEDCCESLIDYCEMLVENTRVLFQQEAVERKGKAGFEIFNGFYEEMKSHFNKIEVACENNDYAGALFATLTLQTEVVELLQKATGNEVSEVLEANNLPNLIEKCKKYKLEDLREALLNFEEIFVNILVEQGVAIKFFNSLEEYEAYTMGRNLAYSGL